MCLEERTKKEHWGVDLSTVTELLAVVSVSLVDSRDEMAQVGDVCKKQLCAFSCEAGDCTDGFYHSCVVKTSVKSQEKSVEKAENSAAEWTKVSASLCTNKTLVETLDLMQVHFFDFKLFMLALLLFEFFFSKGRATHPVKTFCVFSVSIFFPEVK